MKFLSEIFGKKENKIGVVEKKLAELMARKKEVGEFSVDLYYNDGCGEETCYVAKLTMYCIADRGKNITHYARFGNFIDALDAISKYIDGLCK